MQALTLAMLLLAAVLVSSIVDQIVPKVSLPLIQIGIGLIIGLVASFDKSSQINITLDPSLFLVVFIAPLLYDEAKNMDKTALWRHIKPVLSLAIGLVVVTALVIGFAVHLVIPSIGLAAAFALGAALGPTDAVAVTSLSKQVDIPERQKSILKGELLLNDASGIVSFQFALAAAVTGTFSLVDATKDFAVEFFGGLVVGVILAYLGKFLVSKARDLGVENSTFHVLFEVFTPLLVYMISSAVHVSGIIAVVVAGLVNVISPRDIGPSISRMNIVSTSVWRVLSFALNGIVFVLLGTQLPHAMQDTWGDVSIDNGVLIGYVVALTALLFLIRFVWVVAMEFVHWLHGSRAARFGKEELRSSLITTLSGAKGTITLSILFTIPYYVGGVEFPQRDLIIFLACGVIVCTLLVATFVVPLIAPKQVQESESEAREREAEVNVEILRAVVEELTARQTKENRRATQIVVQFYNDRIARIKDLHGIEGESSMALRIEVLHWERDFVQGLAESDEVDNGLALRYLKRLSETERLLLHSAGRWSRQNLHLKARAVIRRVKAMAFRGILSSTNAAEESAGLRQLQLKSSEMVVSRLRKILADPRCEVPAENASAILVEYQRVCVALSGAGAPSVTAITRVSTKENEIKRLGCVLELEQIQSFYEEGELSRATAKRLRDNVSLMLMDVDDNV